MGKYKVFLRKSAYQEILGIPANTRKKIENRISALKSDPRPYGSEKMAGCDFYRVRQGDYRVVYSIDEKEKMVVIEKIGHRKDVYRRGVHED